MSLRNILVLFLALGLFGQAHLADAQTVEIEYNSENSPLIIPLEEGSALNILAEDGSVTGKADSTFACDADCPVCDSCDNVQVDLNAFTVNGADSTTVTQNDTVTFRWKTRGAYTCEGFGLSGTSWAGTGKMPDSRDISGGGEVVKIGEELEPGTYSAGISCFNDTIPSEPKDLTVSVTVEALDENLDASCVGLPPAHMNRALECNHNEPGRDCRVYSDVFGDPFPGNTVTRTFFNHRDEYAAMQFTTSSTLSSGATGKWSVSEPSGTGLPNGGNKIWTISDCPGDFDKSRIESHPDLGAACYERPIFATSSLLWGGESYLNSTSRCGLKPGETYYLNILYTDSPAGTEPDLLEWGCGEGNEKCANKMAPVYNDGE